jgi:DNA polymerase-3 subunit alpha/error-prone DNA polymerase
MGNTKTGLADLFTSQPSPIFGTIAKTVTAPHDKRVHKTNIDMWGEYRALGFLRNAHPLALWKYDVLAVKRRVKALHIGNYAGRPVKMVGWPVTQKDVWTKDGLTMSFLSLEDETAIYETVIFPQVYERCSKLLFDQQPLLVYGLVINDVGAISVEISTIKVLGKQSIYHMKPSCVSGQ